MSRPHASLSADALYEGASVAFAGGDLPSVQSFLDELARRSSGLAVRHRARVQEFVGVLTQQREAERNRLFNRFTVIHGLPTGAGGEAFRVRDTNGIELFLKRAWNHPSLARSSFHREMEVYEKLSTISHPGVLRVLFRCTDGDYLGFATEFADGGTLEDYVYEQTDHALLHAEVKAVAAELTDTLTAIHRAGVVHRDLKPANIVRVEGRWKLVDFGISKLTDQGVQAQTFQQAGTPGYAPPEQWEGVEAAAEADVYALGKVIAFMLKGETDPDLLAWTPWWPIVRACTSRERAHRPPLPTLASWISSL